MNKVILIGRLTADLELNHVAGTGIALCRFNLAMNRPFRKDETDFINCIAFGKNAEILSQYLTKGRQIAINGNIRTRNYDAKDGSKRYQTDVIVETFEFIGNIKNSSDKLNSVNSSNNGFQEIY
ncbi:MAG: single-stranded DNA-binding protein [Clostridium celatum]|uniref:single-stranded DNA-binding protein n=1 Tax=Clostridium tertium TaxID=1559 RepID=UPI002901C9C0|nr:single-stranded DNA-binding protein [Clostridium celatum]